VHGRPPLSRSAQKQARALSLCDHPPSPPTSLLFVHHTLRARPRFNHTDIRIGYTQSRSHIAVIRDASDRVNMAQPDISSILAALGKSLRALSTQVLFESTRLTRSSSSAEPGCYPEFCDSATGAAERTSTRRLSRRSSGANPERTSTWHIPSTAH
jgi:hypothetical protein